MTAVMPPRDALEFPEPVVLNAEEYEALPPNNRRELVDGVVTLMTPATRRHQIVVQKLRAALDQMCPEDLRIVWEQEVRLAPLLRRNPDVMAVLAEADDLDRYSYEPKDVVLAIEVVSPHTQTADRLHKPAEYASVAIEHFWRVEIVPKIAVYTYRVTDNARYTSTGLFTPGDTVLPSGLSWAGIAVDDLAP